MSIRNQDPHSNVPSISEPLRHQHSIYPTRWCVQCTATISSFYPQQCKESRRQEEVSCIHQQDTYIYIYTCVCDGKVPLRKPNKFGAYTYIIIYIYTYICVCVIVCMCAYANIFKLISARTLLEIVLARNQLHRRVLQLPLGSWPVPYGENVKKYFILMCL